MTESKKKTIFEKTREILSKYELTGISKSELARKLQDDGIASRMTFYEYFDEMTNPNGANIIHKVVPKGKINAILFPTPSNQALIELKEKFKAVKNLLDLVEKNPLLGDCFIAPVNLKDVYKSNEKLPPDTGSEDMSILYTELIHAKKSTFGKVESFITLRSHKARHDLLKELPLFLTTYLNSSKMKFSKQVKEESIKILTPIFLRSLKILNDEYSESLNVSKKAKETIQNTTPRDSAVVIRLVKSLAMPHLEVEFLKILGRYYYSMSKQFSKKMEFDSCKEQKLVSKFITSFYNLNDSQKDSSDELDSHDIKEIISLNNNFSLSREKDDMLHEYGFDKDSIAIRLLKTFTKEGFSDDALHIILYYLKLFLTLGLFSKKEQQLLNYVLKQEQATLKSKKLYDPKETRQILSKLFPELYSES